MLGKKAFESVHSIGLPREYESFDVMAGLPHSDLTQLLGSIPAPRQASGGIPCVQQRHVAHACVTQVGSRAECRSFMQSAKKRNLPHALLTALQSLMLCRHTPGNAGFPPPWP